MSTSDPKTIELARDNVVATNVGFEEYAEKYAAHFHEWVAGTVIKMSPIHENHALLNMCLFNLFQIYFKRRPIGIVRPAPFTMKMPTVNRTREPDLQIILNNNPGQYTPTGMIGPADICIEIVSPGTIHVDHGEKFAEYEKAGVGEYWILDQIRNETRFYRLNEEGVYIPQPVSSDGYYTTPTLPNFRLHVPMLWRKELPDAEEIVEIVKQMLGA